MHLEQQVYRRGCLKRQFHHPSCDVKSTKDLFQAVLEASLIDDDETFATLLDRFPNINQPCTTFKYVLPTILAHDPPLAAIPIFCGAVKCFKLLVMMSFDHTARDANGCGMSHFAACGGNMDICRELTDLGLTFEETDESGNTPAHYATLMGHEEVIQWLWTRGVRMNEANVSKETPIMIAALIGRESLCHMFIDLFSSNEELWREVGPSSNRVLVNYACYSGNLDLVRYFIDKKYTAIYCHNSLTPLVYACQEGNFELVKILCEVVPLKEINRRSRKFTALNGAASAGRLDIMEYLLSKGADITVTSCYNESALTVAVLNDDMDLIKRILGMGNKIYGLILPNIFTAVRDASNLDVLKLLWESLNAMHSGDAVPAVSDLDYNKLVQIAINRSYWGAMEYFAATGRPTGKLTISVFATERDDTIDIRIETVIRTFHQYGLSLAECYFKYSSTDRWTNEFMDDSVPLVTKVVDRGLNHVIPLFGNDYHITPEGVIMSKDKTEIIICYKSLRKWVVPNTVIDIGPRQFRGVGLTEIGFESESKVITLGYEAFVNEMIRSIVIPRSVEVIEYRCFAQCSSLRSVIFEEDSNLVGIDREAFSGTALVEITIPKSVEIIGNHCFAQCKELSSVRFEEGSQLTTLSGFNGVVLDSFVVPKSVVRLESGCFSGCRIKELTFEEGSLLKEIPDNGCFHKCMIQSLILPEGLTTIAGHVFFESCIYDIQFDPRNESFKILDGLIISGQSVCSYWNSLEPEQVIIPNYITSIPNKCFSQSKVCEIVFEKDSILTELPPYAFSDCMYLRSIEIPKSVEVIGRKCFAYILVNSTCGTLSMVTFERGSRLRIIEGGAFRRTAIVEIEIPASVREIGRVCFSGCSALKSVVFQEGSQLEKVRIRAFPRDLDIDFPPGAEIESLGTFFGN